VGGGTEPIREAVSFTSEHAGLSAICRTNSPLGLSLVIELVLALGFFKDSRVYGGQVMEETEGWHAHPRHPVTDRGDRGTDGKLPLSETGELGLDSAA